MGFLSPSQPQIVQQPAPAYTPPPAPEAPPAPSAEAPTPDTSEAPEWTDKALGEGWTPPDDTDYSDPRIDAAAKRRANMERKAQGASSLIKTGGKGVTEEAPVRRKTLLGA